MFKKILFTYNMNEENFANKALEVAILQTRTNEAELHIMTVIPGFHMPLVASYFPEDAMNAALKAVEDKLNGYIRDHIPEDIHPIIHVGIGKPYRQVLAYQKKIGADLIVMQSHNPTKMRNIMIGSVASKVVEYAPVSVMVIR